MRQVRTVARVVLLLATFAFYSDVSVVRASPMPVTTEDPCPGDYCVHNWWWENWDCESGGGWECGWDCYQGPEICWYDFDCCYIN